MARSVGAIWPEMGARVTDMSHFRFHVECKAKIINAVNKLRKGMDFIKELSKLSFSTDKKWLANSSNNPNVAVLLEILEEYKKVEKRPSRAKVLVPLFEYAISLYASDLFYVERGEWLIYQLCANRHRFRFHTCFVEPQNWYPAGRGNNSYDYEMNNTPVIENEYSEWYGIDPTDDNSVISYDMKKVEELIESQKKMADYDRNEKLRQWAKDELEKIE